MFKAGCLQTALLWSLLAVIGRSLDTGSVFVHLFEWPWKDVALECETVLGPAGFAAVQISPPQEHVKGSEWWTRYQPVSYNIESRGGTRQQFRDMVKRCQAVGVDIYADLVVNHMIGGDQSDCGNGVFGSRYCKYHYPGLYSTSNFHEPCNIEGKDYVGNLANVHKCELLGLSDLATDDPYVRTQISGYIMDLVSLGVKGMRIDAAKHIPPEDIEAFIAPSRSCGGQDCAPYYFLEIPNIEVVFGIAREAVQPEQYRFLGAGVTAFKFGFTVRDHFKNQTLGLSGLRKVGENPSTIGLPSSEAVTFIDNHDTQRENTPQGRALSYKDGDLYHLANIYMLAVPYGYPKIMSSFSFNERDDGAPTSPPHDGEGCSANGWVCEHRSPRLLAMVRFRNVATAGGNFQQTDWWDNGKNAIAFGRGDNGHVVINRQSSAIEETLRTRMEPGRYCDVLSGERNAAGNACTGKSVTVDDNGQVRVLVPGMDAVAFHTGSRCTAQFDQVFIRGTFNNWQAQDQMKCAGPNLWELDVDLQGSENSVFKFDTVGDWSLNYGLGASGSNRLVEFGASIPAVSDGLVTIRFNDAEKTVSQDPRWPSHTCDEAVDTNCSIDSNVQLGST